MIHSRGYIVLLLKATDGYAEAYKIFKGGSCSFRDFCRIFYLWVTKAGILKYDLATTTFSLTHFPTRLVFPTRN